MKTRYEPSRLATRAGGAPEIAAAITALRAEQVSSADIEALARRLAPELAAPTVAGSAAPLLAGWAKKGLLGVAVSLAVGTLVATSAHRGARVAQPRHAVPPVVHAAPRASAPVAPALPAGTSIPGVTVPAPPVPSRPLALPRRSLPKPAPTQPAPERELVLLERSRAALDTEPSRALDLAEQHAHDYPNGIFTQEREMLAIEALLKLGRKPQARTRAEAFLEHFPESPHARRVRTWIERTPDLPVGAQ